VSREGSLHIFYLTVTARSGKILAMKAQRISAGFYFALLAAAGVKQHAIAHALNVSESCVSRWRAGLREIGDAHYQQLCDLALSWEPLFRAMHHAAKNPEGLRSPEDGTVLFRDSASSDVRAFQTEHIRWQLAELSTLTAADPATWDYALFRAYAENLAGMARALEQIAKEIT
jgi:hypothetical protein